MQIEDYLDMINNFAIAAEENEIDAHTFICQKISNHDDQLIDSIHFRIQLLTNEDKIAFHDFAFAFHDQDAEEALACVGICFDIEREMSRRNISRICSPYSANQIVFKNYPFLFEKLKNKELINYDYLEQIDDTEIFRIDGQYVLLEDYINPKFIKWIRNEYRNANIFIRIKADSLFSKQPSMIIIEEVLVPPDPDWLKSLKIYPNSVKKASFILQEPSCEHSLQYLWDYKGRKIRRLEIRAQRNNNGNLRLMVEELPAIDSNNGYFIGLCVHLDTSDEVGTDFSASILNHIDLALNVYVGDKMEKRFEQSLTNGIIEDASYRTHLIRLENVPFKIVLNLVHSSFRSKTLINEWIEAQFKGL